MRYLTSTILFLFLCSLAIAQGPLVTEISYDNNYDQDDPFGIDSIEYVEIYLPNPQPTDLASFKIVTYDESSGVSTDAEVAFVKDLEDTLRTWDTPNGKYYVIEFVDSTFFGFPIGGIRDGEDGIALVEIGTPNITHQFWRYETCTSFTAIDGPAVGAVSDPITTDFSRACGTAGVSLVQMNSALATTQSIQQNGFGDWGLTTNTAQAPPLENNSNVPVEMIFFRAIADEDYVFLSWATAQEFDNNYFAIYHSIDGKNFEEVGKVDGKGNYSGESRYDFRHYPEENGTHFYYIRQVDFNGNYEDFDIRSVELRSDEHIQANPSFVQYDFQLTNIDQGEIVSIYDLNGQKVLEVKYQDSVVLDKLPSGMYVVQVRDHVIKITKQ